MSTNAPQKLSVKRKRGEVPVESLLIADSPKRHKSDGSSLKRKLETPQDEDNKRTKAEESGTVVWRLLRRPDSAQAGREIAVPQTPPATAPPTRRFHVSRTAGNVVLFEHKGQDQPQSQQHQQTQTPLQEAQNNQHTQAPPQPAAATPRKRPGARASHIPSRPALEAKALGTGPSEATIRAFEKFSAEVESGLSPSRPKPKAPKKRYSQRHPAEAYALAHPDAMDLDPSLSPHARTSASASAPQDTDEYVYDTYVLETLPSETLARAPESLGTVGYIVLTAEDEEWWYDSDGSTDREFDTDDEDSNAEEYYANDYPEDELSEDDEFDRSPYKHYHDENDDLYDFERDFVGSDEERSDAELELGGKVVRGKSMYWGRSGED